MQVRGTTKIGICRPNKSNFTNPTNIMSLPRFTNLPENIISKQQSENIMKAT
jgi:hypothetical protein